MSIVKEKCLHCDGSGNEPTTAKMLPGTDLCQNCDQCHGFGFVIVPYDMLTADELVENGMDRTTAEQ